MQPPRVLRMQTIPLLRPLPPVQVPYRTGLPGHCPSRPRRSRLAAPQMRARDPASFTTHREVVASGQPAATPTLDPGVDPPVGLTLPVEVMRHVVFLLLVLDSVGHLVLVEAALAPLTDSPASTFNREAAALELLADSCTCSFPVC